MMSRPARATTIVRMEWLALLVWLLLAGMGLAMGIGALSTPGAGLVPLAAVGGLATTVVFIITSSFVWAWIAFGLAVLGIIATSVAAAFLVSSDRGISAAGQTGEEIQAAVAGIALPLFGTVVCMSLLVALDLVTATT
jgi:hypothetical protein